jgi:hypothetical protein
MVNQVNIKSPDARVIAMPKKKKKIVYSLPLPIARKYIPKTRNITPITKQTQKALDMIMLMPLSNLSSPARIKKNQRHSIGPTLP